IRRCRRDGRDAPGGDGAQLPLVGRRGGVRGPVSAPGWSACSHRRYRKPASAAATGRSRIAGGGLTVSSVDVSVQMVGSSPTACTYLVGPVQAPSPPPRAERELNPGAQHLAAPAVVLG